MGMFRAFQRLHDNDRQPLLGDHVVTCLDGVTGGILWQRTFRHTEIKIGRNCDNQS